jgi:hypothetical protein
MQACTLRFLVAALMVTPTVTFADSSYEQIVQVTGGQLVDAIKNIPFMPKQMKQLTAPNSTVTMVRGNQKAVVSKEYTDITDLDKEVIIHIDNEKKTYTVTTFEEMRKMIAQMPQKIDQMQEQAKDGQAKAQADQSQMPPSTLQTTFTTSVTDPGVTKVVNGQDAKEQILTLKMIVTDTANPGTNVTYTMTSEIWTTAFVPTAMKDLRDFDMRFGKALMAGADMSAFRNMGRSADAAMAQMFAGRPGAADAFAQMKKESAKIQGTRVLEITRMGGSGTGMQPASGTAQSSNATTTDGAATQAAKDTTTQTAAGELGRLNIPGGALGSSIAGAFHRKKAAPPAATPDTTSNAPPANGATQGTPPAAGTQAPVDVTLLEMTTQTTNFSRETIPSSVFDIPSGYKQTTSRMSQMGNK